VHPVKESNANDFDQGWIIRFGKLCGRLSEPGDEVFPGLPDLTQKAGTKDVGAFG
jgi:hypothetical protein